MNGWMRLWVVISAFYIAVGLIITVSQFPTKQSYQYYWVSDGTRAIAEAFTSKGTRGYVSPSDVRDSLLIGRSEEDVIAWFQKVVISPAPESDIYVQAIAQVNARYVGAVPAYQREFLFTAVLALLLPVIVLFVVGWSIAWVIRGFRKPPPDDPQPGQ